MLLSSVRELSPMPSPIKIWRNPMPLMEEEMDVDEQPRWAERWWHRVRRSTPTGVVPKPLRRQGARPQTTGTRSRRWRSTPRSHCPTPRSCRHQARCARRSTCAPRARTWSTVVATVGGSYSPSLHSQHHVSSGLVVPYYMAASESAMARICFHNIPRRRSATLERDRKQAAFNAATNKQLSFSVPLDPYGGYVQNLRSGA